MKASLAPSRTLRRVLASALFAVTSVGVSAPAVSAQSSTEIIRGRVFGPDSTPLAAAEVLVTGLATQIIQRTRTDQHGSFTVLFTNPEADYIIAVRKIGYVSATQRLSRTGISNVLAIDITLRNTARQLDTVMVSSNDEPGVKRAAGEQSSSDLAEALFLADPSNLMQLLLSIPGAGILFDSSNAQALSTTTIDGANFRGRDLPPDALASARGITSTADPAKGGFAGGNVSTTMRGGTDILAATVRGSMTDPSTMAWSDPAWTRPLTAAYDNSGTVNGPIVKGKLRFNTSWQMRYRSSDLFSLLQPRGDVLSQQGVGLDTVAAVRNALTSLGIPLTTGAIPSRNVSKFFAMSDVFDWTPTATTSIRLTHNGNWNGVMNDGSNVTAYPTRASDGGFHAQFISLRASGYVKGLLNELTTSYNSYNDYANPFLDLPSASVRVGTSYPDGRTAFTNLQFGGGSGMNYEKSIGTEVIDEISWLPKDGSHKVKIGGRYAADRSDFYSFDNGTLLGRYSYLTIADLVANKPASYDRLLNTRARRTTAANSAVWVGDEWAVSRSWQLQGGLRFDFANPGTRPEYNRLADSVFGIHTDRIPNDVGMSPRLGFSWASKARLGRGTAGGAASLGGMSAAQVQMMSPELVRSLLDMERSGASTLPGIGVNGTIGVFRGATSTNTIADYVEASGVGTRSILSCAGAAVPLPDWRHMSNGPTQCADGSTATNGISSPLVRVFDPGFHSQASWRANVSVDGIRIPNKWIVKLTASGNYNFNGQSGIDINLNPTPKFLLASEGNRPVYVDATSIFPSTGTISSAASRVSPLFTTVTRAVSDLRQYNWQLGASLAPPRPLFGERVQVQLNYSLTRGEQESRGNSRIGITGDPFTKEWVRTNQPLHSFRANINGRIWWLNAGISTSLVSGIPFTPRVTGDVNGDGDANNDRAFIPNPATTADTSLARQMNQLIASAPAAARRCLTSQLGRMAGASNCSMPWQFRMDVNASLSPPSSWGYSDRLRITFATQNASGGLVRLLGLQNTPFGQNSLSTIPNQTLLYVTGYDPATNSFKYRVNQLFGQANNYGSLRQRFAPIQMQLGLEYKFGGPPINPVARALGFREPVGKEPLSDAQRRAAVAKLKKDPVAPLLKVKDSLSLSQDQVASLSTLSQEYSAKADAALKPLTDWITRKGTRIFDQDLSPRLAEVRADLAKVQLEYDRKAKGVLTAEQATRAQAMPKER
jgi:hypothetical protein